MNDRTRLELLERMLPAVREMTHAYALPKVCEAVRMKLGPGNILAGLVRDLDALDATSATAKIATLRAERDAAREEVGRLRDALEGVASWCEAYPAQVFPQESADAALAACKAAGIPVDAMHGTWARHLLTGIGRDARAATLATAIKGDDT